MPLHYTKSGNLDMRYSSSKAAMSSGSYASGGYSSGSYSSGRSSYGSPAVQSGLHYKKDGTLDMRYSSSREAASSASPSSYCSSNYSGTYSGSSSGYNSDLHYKKDGTLDMRYSSSKEAMFSVPRPVGSSDIHLKKDGTPDMRYKSSREITELGLNFKCLNVSPNSGLHYKKDGTLDMRFTSSKLATGSAFAGRQSSSIPSSIPLTKSGLPDMRTKAAKLWVEEQGKLCSPGNLPSWIPRKKDGTADMTKAAAQSFFDSNRGITPMEWENDHTCRMKYYEKRLLDDEYRTMVSKAREASICLPQPYMLPMTNHLRRELSAASNASVGETLEDVQHSIPSTIPLIDYQLLKTSFGDEEKATLGKGNFGVVLKGKLDEKEVAVKRLHLNKLNKKENQSFVKELKILALLGNHPNLVKLYGYVLEPPCLVMEYVKLGSLSYLIHYCEDTTIEAKVTDGRVKKLLTIGIVDGMRQLHAANIVHGDLKPANVLVTSDFVAKVSDFGLSTLRGKTSSSVASSVKDDGETAVAGTAGYMAPELLDTCKGPELSCDIYSFAILLNELIHEEEPYHGHFQHFQGRGPFAAVLYAKNGNRPYMRKDTIPSNVCGLIEKCWNSNPSYRPTFEEISTILQQRDLVFPNSFS